MAIRSRKIYRQIVVVLTAALAVAALIFVWKIDSVVAVLMGDWRPLALNGVILLLFLLGTWQLLRGVRHYSRQEIQIDRFIVRRAQGRPTAEALADCHRPSLLRDRYDSIKALFDQGGPVDHGAISAIMLADESQQLSFPRFVNNVLILTGVFGTVSSLIFALIGATEVLQTAVPGTGMGLLLLGMNTALTTTATAIVCYFFFTYFFHRLADLQTWVLGRLEQASLLYMVPDFADEAEAVNHQTKLLVEDVRQLVAEMKQGLGAIGAALQGIDESTRARHAQGEQILARQQDQAAKLDEALARLDGLRSVLIEGFRLDR